MATISDLKERAVTEAPILLFDCVLPDGRCEHWSTHGVVVANTAYEARVLEHSSFVIQTASDQGIDGSPKLGLTLANADSHFSEIERSTGWKGSKLTASFVFFDLVNAAALTDITVVFQGVCNPPEQIREATFRLSAINRMSLQRLLLPEVRIQRRCPWTFPATVEQRAEAVDGGSQGLYSRYYRCGYSAGQSGGAGTLNGGSPFTSCGYTRSDCAARGLSQRFGGLEFVPPVIAVRGYGKDWSTSALAVNQARYNDFVPMLYGTAWYEPLVCFARNDGNLTRMQVLLGLGPMQGVLTVLVNDVEIPKGVAGANMTGTGWYNVMSLGDRDGTYDSNFTGGNGNPGGDPYGSMAYLSVAVPNKLSDGSSLPTVKVLAQGLRVPTYDADGSALGYQFSNNPAWVLLDVLRRTGWQLCEVDLPSFAKAAAYCEEPVGSMDLNGNPISIARFHCNLALQKRKSAGDAVRGIRNGARLFLTYGPGGILQLQAENSLALQQSVKPTCSNSTVQLNGGWPAYEFGDGSNGFSGLLRKESGEPNITLTARSMADTPNCLTIDFQDELNGYQQDSYTVVDPHDISSAGQQVTSTLMALGIPNYDQAARILQFNLDKSVAGNMYIDFETSVRGFGIRPGDIVSITYLKEGLNRQPFRVLKISPATNYRTCAITAQLHDDAWYADSNGQPNSVPGVTHPTSGGVGVPRPLVGSTIDADENIQFGLAQFESIASDGTATASISVSFVEPTAAAGTGVIPPGAPLVNLVPAVGPTGSLKGGECLYYAVTGVDGAGNEGGLSFLVWATTLSDNSSVTISGLSFTAGTATGLG